MIKTIRVMMLQNNKQKTKLFQYAGTARFAYNWALEREQENHENGENLCRIPICEKNLRN